MSTYSIYHDKGQDDNETCPICLDNGEPCTNCGDTGEISEAEAKFNQKLDNADNEGDEL